MARDWWENPPNDLAPLLRRAREVVLKRGSPLGTIGTGILNRLYPPFDKPAVRRAILRAMSQEDFMTAAAGVDPSLWRAGAGVFTPGTPLASEAGIEAITVDYRVSDWGTLAQRRASRESVEKGGWSMFHTTWNGLDGINPGVMTYLRANGPQAWFGWPTVPRLETLRQAWFDAPDLRAQKAIAADIQRVVFDEAPCLPTGQYFANIAYRRTITEPVSEVLAFWEVKRV